MLPDTIGLVGVALRCLGLAALIGALYVLYGQLVEWRPGKWPGLAVAGIFCATATFATTIVPLVITSAVIVGIAAFIRFKRSE